MAAKKTAKKSAAKKTTGAEVETVYAVRERSTPDGFAPLYLERSHGGACLCVKSDESGYKTKRGAERLLSARSDSDDFEIVTIKRKVKG